MIPRSTIDALKRMHNVILGSVGINVTLYIPTNSTTLESLDPFKTIQDRVYTTVETTAFINWSPDQVQLKKLNLYNEDDIPILCHLPNDFNVQIETDSYLTVPVEQVPRNITVNEFEIVNKKIPNMHDTVIFPVFVLVPRRKT
jgi:hypothetical protein